VSHEPQPFDPSFLVCIREWLERVPNPAALLDHAGRVWWSNPSWSKEAERFGEVGEHLPTAWARSQSPRLSWMVQDVLAGHQPTDIRVGPLDDRQGEQHWYQVEAIAVPLDDAEPCAVVQIRAVDGLVELVHRLQHENEQMERRLVLLEQLSERDPATGLLDRRGLERTIARELDHIDRTDADGRSGVVRLRLFASRSDVVSREQVLPTLAHALMGSLRPRDEAAVLPDGDLVLVLPDQRQEDIEMRARAIADLVGETAARAGLLGVSVRFSITALVREDARVRDVLVRTEAGLEQP
jgi:GGDEF domain-containing protein